MKPFVRLGIDLKISGPVARIVDAVAHARIIELRDTAGSLTVDASCSRPQVSAVAGAVFTLPGIGGVALIVVVVVDEFEKTALKAVIPSAIGPLDVRVDRDHLLNVAGIGSGRGGIEPGVGICPEQRGDALAADGIGAQSITPTPVFWCVFPCAIHAPLALCVIVVDCKRIVASVVSCPGNWINLRSFVPIASQPLAAKADAVPVV